MNHFTFRSDPDRHRQEYSLNGTWQIQPGTSTVKPIDFCHSIPVPSLIDCAVPTYNWQQFDSHWYKIEFELDGEFQNKHFFLKLGQAAYGTSVFLNGYEVGGSISCYTSQEYNVDSFLLTGRNELIIRIGQRANLPKESAVGNDQEKEFFLPGIWGDVSLVSTGQARVKRVQIIPHLEKFTAEARICLENLQAKNVCVNLFTSIAGWKEGDLASAFHEMQSTCGPGETQVVVEIPLHTRREWSPEDPYLYEFRCSVQLDSKKVDEYQCRFGMREFRIIDGDFQLNNKKIFLHGSNIAFHRFLNDPHRCTLPWNREWIRRLLIDIPKEYNFNFFRIHNGHAYNAWYDIADEYGILLQDEWQFWRVSGTKNQIIKEFTEWIQDNVNHPSIIIWDALNECTDPMVEQEVVPLMKQLDPTRPWEPVDFQDQHPYIFSLCPVLNDRKMGFGESLHHLQSMPTPCVVNEFLWWWLDNENKPTILMKNVMERWLGTTYTTEMLVERQSYLATELIELFRRLGADAIQPFVYLSNGNGPTGNWFLGNISDLHPKPVLKAIANAFAQVGVSIELWDRHFFVDEQRKVAIHIFNDTDYVQHLTIKYGLMEITDLWLSHHSQNAVVEPHQRLLFDAMIVFPSTPMTLKIRAELFIYDSKVFYAVSEKPAMVVSAPQVSAPQDYSVSVLDESKEFEIFLTSKAVQLVSWNAPFPKANTVCLVHGASVRSKDYQNLCPVLSDHIRHGGLLILVEPEYGIQTPLKIDILSGLQLSLTPRDDKDKGGYDSYVFAEDAQHPLWTGIPSEALKMFNGAWGGEIVSEHKVKIDSPHKVLARCGIGLEIIAAAEVPYGAGKVIISRLQLRGRLVSSKHASDLFDRRPDPVAQQYLLNLLSL